MAEEVFTDLKMDPAFNADTPAGEALRAAAEAQIDSLTRRGLRNSGDSWSEEPAFPLPAPGKGKNDGKGKKGGPPSGSGDADGAAAQLTGATEEEGQAGGSGQLRRGGRGGGRGGLTGGGSAAATAAAAWGAMGGGGGVGGDAFDSEVLAQFGLDETGKPTGGGGGGQLR